MTIKILEIKPNGECTTHTFDKCPDLQWFQDSVAVPQCSMIELTKAFWFTDSQQDQGNVYVGYTYKQMIVNEEGLIHQLPINPIATALYNGPRQFVGNPIVGTALVMLEGELD